MDQMDDLQPFVLNKLDISRFTLLNVRYLYFFPKQVQFSFLKKILINGTINNMFTVSPQIGKIRIVRFHYRAVLF